ncbi:hypothetical protein D3C75_913850 [compost metagenome]
MFTGFHAFGHHFQAQAFGKDDGGRHDRAVVVAVGQRRNQRAVDLQFAQRQRVQVGEAGVAAAEIVQADAQASVAQGVQVRHRRAFGVEDGGFGDFQLQPLRGDGVLLQFAQ